MPAAESDDGQQQNPHQHSLLGDRSVAPFTQAANRLLDSALSRIRSHELLEFFQAAVLQLAHFFVSDQTIGLDLLASLPDSPRPCQAPSPSCCDVEHRLRSAGNHSRHRPRNMHHYGFEHHQKPSRSRRACEQREHLMAHPQAGFIGRGGLGKHSGFGIRCHRHLSLGQMRPPADVHVFAERGDLGAELPQSEEEIRAYQHACRRNAENPICSVSLALV